jgi:hypothetical protein
MTILTADLVNGIFEVLASVFILNHVRVLWKSKQAHGVSLVSTVFFACWGVFNLFYYPHLDQRVSFYAGISVMAANLIWIYSIWRFRRTMI